MTHSMHQNPEFRTALEKQYLSIRDAPISVVHRWLCHPDGEECPDGCTVRGRMDRVAAMERVETALTNKN